MPKLLDLSSPFLAKNALWIHGSKGIGIWTTQPDKDGFYYAGYLKPSGPGARDNNAESYKYVTRLETRRKTRSNAKKRAVQLANGESSWKKGEAATPVDKTKLPGQGYCMSEKKRVIMTDIVCEENEKGRMVIRGKCPDCGTKIQKFGKMALCPECNQMAEMDANDYICKACRVSV